MGTPRDSQFWSSERRHNCFDGAGLMIVALGPIL